jgi:hypothetical protein
MHMIFTPDDSGTDRGIGYATVEYSSDSEDETVIETTDKNVTAVFEDAKQEGETLDGTDQPIDSATDDPLAFLDFLILVDGEIEFDSDYERQPPA